MSDHIWLKKNTRKLAVDGGIGGCVQYHRHVIAHKNTDISNNICTCGCHDPVNWKPKI